MAQVSQVMKMSITRYEFAQALGMKHTDLFVEKMFRIIDRDKDGKISFQEFLETVTRFSMPQASADQTNQNFKDDKLRIVFEMCDSNKDGRVDKAELQEMLTSLIRFATATCLSKIYYPNSNYLDNTTVEIECIPNYVLTGSIESTALNRVCYL